MTIQCTDAESKQYSGPQDGGEVRIDNMLAPFVVQSDAAAGIRLARSIQAYQDLSDTESRAKEIVDFGIPQSSVDEWRKLPVEKRWSHPFDCCLTTVGDACMRLRVNGVTKLGLYIASIREILQGRFCSGTILDFGCGAWPDASIALASGSNLKVQLVDIKPLSLSFSAYKCQMAGVRCIPTHVSVDNEFDQVEDDVVAVVESTSMEHIKDARRLWPRLISLLPHDGLLLCNYTRVDWSRPEMDGYVESKSYVNDAIKHISLLAERAAWEPEQDDGHGWDLWSIRQQVIGGHRGTNSA